jgi:hypothetical protein
MSLLQMVAAFSVLSGILIRGVFATHNASLARRRERAKGEFLIQKMKLTHARNEQEEAQNQIRKAQSRLKTAQRDLDHLKARSERLARSQAEREEAIQKGKAALLAVGG